MSRRIIDDQQYRQQVDLYKQLLIDQIQDLTIEPKRPNSDLVIDKMCVDPTKFILYVSIHPKVRKFIVGVKMFGSKLKKEALKNVYESLPFDVRDKYRDAAKYVCVSNTIKFKDVPTQNTIKLVKESLHFYKQVYKDFLI